VREIVRLHVVNFEEKGLENFLVMRQRNWENEPPRRFGKKR